MFLKALSKHLSLVPNLIRCKNIFTRSNKHSKFSNLCHCFFFFFFTFFYVLKTGSCLTPSRLNSGLPSYKCVDFTFTESFCFIACAFCFWVYCLVKYHSRTLRFPSNQFFQILARRETSTVRKNVFVTPENEQRTLHICTNSEEDTCRNLFTCIF